MKYIITYELNSKSKQYSGLYEAIKGLGSWWHYIENTWIIKDCDIGPDEIFEKLSNYIDTESDFILIIEVDPSSRQGWLPNEAWEWLDED